MFIVLGCLPDKKDERKVFVLKLQRLPGGLVFKTASHTLILRMKALSSCSMCDSNVSELFTVKSQIKTIVKIHILKRNLYTKAFIKEIHESTPDWQQCRLGNLKHKSLHWMVLFVHDDHHYLLCIVLEEDWTRMKSWETNHSFLNQTQHQVTSYLLNERLHTVKSILNVLIQLWVTWHLKKAVGRI